MILEKLTIDLKTYGPNKGQYESKARFVGNDGAVEIRLSSGQTQGILNMCGDAIVKQSKEVATALTAVLIDQELPKFLRD